jgi:hypothetical protein
MLNCARNFFVKSVFSLDSQLPGFGRVMRLQFYALEEQSQAQPKQTWQD